MDHKCVQLAACTSTGTDFVRKGMKPFKWTGSTKCADYTKIIEEGPGDFIFKNSLPPAIATPVQRLLELLRLLKSASCDVDDPDAEGLLRLLKAKVIDLVCHYERYFPRSEICRVSHITLHVIDMVHRWNNVRNFWCFLTERYLWL
jgi:hypothetical protein